MLSLLMMELSGFIVNLLTKGKVSVKGRLESFEKNDLDEAKRLLKDYYDADILEMSHAVPGYSEEAALWAAEYLYKAVQLTVIRDAGKEIVEEQLKAYAGLIDVSAIFSADLMLRYLPQLFHLAKGLAPGDVLVEELRKIALQWPFSSVGVELDNEIEDDLILENPSLRVTYIDRITMEKNKQRIKKPLVENCIHEAAGQYLAVFWQGFENSQKQNSERTDDK